MDDLQLELSKSRIFTLGDQSLEIDAEQPHISPNAFELTNRIIDKKYQILRPIGAGGMGCVYLARHLMLGKDVALKTFKSRQLTESAHSRFTREAQAIARLNHRNIVQVFDFGRIDDEMPYYTMEFLEGVSLADRLQESTFLPVEAALDIFAQVCDGLDAAHKKGIIHRDLKPDNIFLQKNAGSQAALVPKIVDFGIATLAVSDLEGQRLTSSGEIFGSPLYMSPEQSLGLEVTSQSDVYSCGCALFQTLTGKPPFLGPNAFNTMVMHQNAAIPTLREVSGGREFSPALENLLKNMLAKDPQKRLQGAAQVADNLLRIAAMTKKTDSQKLAETNTDAESTAPQPAKPKRKALIAVGLAIIAFGSVAFGFLNQQNKLPGQARQSSATKIIPEVNRPKLTSPVGIEALPDGGKISDVESITTRTKAADYIELDYQPLTEDYWQMALRKVRVKNDLTLGNRRLPPKTFVRLAQVQGLKSLHIDYCFIDQGADLSPLSKLPELTDFQSRETNLSDADFSQVALCKNVSKLSFIRVPVSDRGVAALATMKNLKQLALTDCGEITDQGVQALSRCPQLTYLDLDKDSKITGAAARSLTKMKLQHLKLEATGFDDSGLMQLASLPDLKELSLGYTKVTAAGIRAFMKHKTGYMHFTLNGKNVISNVDFEQLKKDYFWVKFARKSEKDDD